MSATADTPLRTYKTLALERKGRLLTIALNRPEALNAVNDVMHEELSDAFNFAALDEHSDVVVPTGFGRAKEYLLTGELLAARKAEEIGLINHCVPAAELDGAVDAFCERLLKGSSNAIRWTKVLINLELKRVATAVMDAGIAYEALSVRSAEHRAGVEALMQKQKRKADR